MTKREIIRFVIAILLIILEFTFVALIIYFRFFKHDYDLATTLGYVVIFTGLFAAFVYPYGAIYKIKRKKS